MTRLKRPSPALVISVLALVAALVVPAYAALNKKDKKTVKNIANTEITKRAPGLAVASANNANTAGNANTVDGQNASDFAAVGSEAWQPMTLNDGGGSCFWTPVDPTQPAYFRDGFGVVHLRGLVDANDGPLGGEVCGDDLGGDDSLITTLPTGYRPETGAAFSVVSNNKAGRVNVNPTGNVDIQDATASPPSLMRRCSSRSTASASAVLRRGRRLSVGR